MPPAALSVQRGRVDRRDRQYVRCGAGKTITERQAAQGLITNVLRVERALDKCVVQPMPQKVYDAVVSFAFNVGTGNACSSTLVKLLNQRRWADACHQLPRWVYVKGVFNQGLDNRRARKWPGA
jgi:lysozyme